MKHGLIAQRPVWARALAMAGLFAAVVAGTWAYFPLAPPSGPTLVRGYIAVTVGGRGMGLAGVDPVEQIHLSSVEVVLRQAGTSVDSEPVVTDLSGRFTAHVKSPGSYQVCWKVDGFGSGCVA